MKIKLAPSMMCANWLNAGEDIKALEDVKADMLHMDVMDGHFVPNMCIPFYYIKAIAAATDIPCDVHLMVEDPIKWLPNVKDCGAKYVSIHYESTKYPIRTISDYKKAGFITGVALNPVTSAEQLYALGDLPDFVLLMTVDPGFSGQSFIPTMYNKIKRTREILDEINPKAFIQIDGCVNTETANRSIELGADTFICGTSSIFKKGIDLRDSYENFKKSLNL